MGIRASKKSILKILRVNGFSPPRTKFAPPPWGSVLSSFSRYWSMDFTCVFDMGGLQIFIFAIIEVLSRRLILINATAKPTKEWLIQKFRNCCISGHAFPGAMVHDRDGIYGLWLQDVLLEFECPSIRTPPRSPWLNPYIERFFGSLKREVLDRQFLVDSEQIQKSSLSYQVFYNEARPHQGIDGKAPNGSMEPEIYMTDIGNMKLEKTPRRDGLITQFYLAA